MKSARSGYSLVEILVVVAIVGIITLAGVPQFLKYSRSAAVRAAANQVVGDIRAVRQKAVEQTGLARISFGTGPNARSYSAYLSIDNGGTWTLLWTKGLEEGCYFESTTFTDVAGDANPDIQFRPSGIRFFLPEEDMTDGNVVIRSTYDLPLNRYTISMTYAGQLKAVGSHV